MKGKDTSHSFTSNCYTEAEQTMTVSFLKMQEPSLSNDLMLYNKSAPSWAFENFVISMTGSDQDSKPTAPLRSSHSNFSFKPRCTSVPVPWQQQRWAQSPLPAPQTGQRNRLSFYHFPAQWGQQQACHHHPTTKEKKTQNVLKVHLQ